jgi:hypothetical protein
MVRIREFRNRISIFTGNNGEIEKKGFKQNAAR